MNSIIEYFQTIDIDFVTSTLKLLLTGALVTLEITLVAVTCGVLIGLFVGIAELSNYKILKYPAKVYVDIVVPLYWFRSLLSILLCLHC